MQGWRVTRGQIAGDLKPQITKTVNDTSTALATESTDTKTPARTLLGDMPLVANTACAG